ncbi:MAG TPA: D-alanyl-D-alanine carboxypeptidase [Firmicutes bacterium]|nr:D-alanyl-D-alanine carboxypeptidase [Bacillota bacterium]
MRYGISILMISLLVLLTIAFPSEAAALPQISSKAAALFDLATGEVLAGINADAQVYPASTTKVLTALLVIELADLSEMVTISRNAEHQEGTALYCKEGEEYPVLDLLYAMLVQSANDVSVALAEHVAGSVADFADLMNAKAKELGATDSNFVNPSGLPDKNHYTTARDMARIFSAAFKEPLIREITSTRVYYINLPSGERRPLINGNKMLTEYEGTLGGKTGYTSAAGNCIVTAAQSGNLKLGVAVFKAQGAVLWQDAKALLNYGFTTWSSISFIGREQAITAVPARYAGEKVLLVAGDDLQITRAKGDENLPVTWQLSLESQLQAPLARGQAVGEVTYFLDGQPVGTVEAIVAHDVARNWYTYWEFLLVFGFVGVALRFINPKVSNLHSLKRR